MRAFRNIVIICYDNIYVKIEYSHTEKYKDRKTATNFNTKIFYIVYFKQLVSLKLRIDNMPSNDFTHSDAKNTCQLPEKLNVLHLRM